MLITNPLRHPSRLLKNSLRAAQGCAAIFQTRCKCLKNEAQRKSRFSLCLLKKPMDGLFQQPAKAWLVSVLAAGGLCAAVMAGTVHADADKSEKKISRVAQPTIIIEKEGECVEPEDVMRRDHMKFILHQRDMTMHQGIRTEKYSLKNCINCHANSKTNSVLGKDGFCESCHSYAAVSIDCFSCHSSSPEKNTTPPSAVVNNKKSPDPMGQSSPVVNQASASTGKAP